jgi:hypothetical protein
MTVIRLRRVGDVNVPSVLDSARVSELWSDPVLRYSNLLDGLFHSGVVLCESDGDARLYGAALEEYTNAQGLSSADLLFAQSGGKAGLPKAIRVLDSLSVPIAAVADIDVLRDEALLKKIVEALDGDWTEAMATDFGVVSSAVKQLPAAAPVIRDVSDQISQTLGEDMSARLTEEHSRRIRAITKSSDGWRLVRDSGGLNAIPNGDARSSAERLVEALADTGLFVVRDGALEHWAPTIGKDGPAFVSAALAQDVHRENAALHAFVTRIATFLAAPGEAATPEEALAAPPIASTDEGPAVAQEE